MKSDPINPTDFPRPPLWESVASLASLAMLLAGTFLLSRFPIAGICMIAVSLAFVSWFFVRDLRRRSPAGRAFWLRLLCTSLAVVFLLMTLFLAWRISGPERALLIGAFALMTLLAAACAYAAHRWLARLRRGSSRRP